MFAFWVCIVSRDREFIARNYVDLKALNPTLPLLIRECSGVQPRLWARYDYGVERSVPLDGLAAHEIDVKLEELVNLGIPER
jgi:NADH dehydrogenase (ubiquinone) 1 alpha subcomplex subunit 2